jgi:hypothetical protein
MTNDQGSRLHSFSEADTEHRCSGAGLETHKLVEANCGHVRPKTLADLWKTS